MLPVDLICLENSRKLCPESVAANANVRGKFESLQTLFWIQRLPSCQDLFNWNKGKFQEVSF